MASEFSKFREERVASACALVALRCMGQKASKGGASSSPSSVGSLKATGPPKDVLAALNDETQTQHLKAWAKQQGASMLHAVVMLEQIGKRRAVYTSGKKCGDSDEALQEKMRKLAEALMDKYVESGCDTPAGGLSDATKAALAAADHAQLEAFDAAAEELKRHIEGASQ